MSFLALLLAGPAAAADLSAERIDALVDALIPVVEAEAGRRFDHRPPLVMATRSDIGLVLHAEQLHLLTGARLAGLDDDEIARTAAASARAMARVFIGKYGFLDQKLYFAPEQLEHALSSRGISDEAAIPIAEVVLAHELTHALQDQHIGLGRMVSSRPDGDGVIALNCLVEGHAVWMQERVGYARGLGPAVELMADVLGYRLDGRGLPGEPERFYTAYVYGAGRDFVAWHAERGGRARTWEILEAPPPRSSMITSPRTYEPVAPQTLAPELVDAVRAAADRLTPRGWVVVDEVVGDFDLREELIDRSRDDALADHWEAGWRARAVDSPEVGLEVQVLAFDDARTARRWVESMRQNAQRLLAAAMHPIPGALASEEPDVIGSVTAFEAVESDGSARESITLQLGGPPQVLGTVWVARDRWVVQVVTRNRRVRDGQLARAIDRVFRALPSD